MLGTVNISQPSVFGCSSCTQQFPSIFAIIVRPAKEDKTAINLAGKVFVRISFRLIFKLFLSQAIEIPLYF